MCKIVCDIKYKCPSFPGNCKRQQEEEKRVAEDEFNVYGHPDEKKQKASKKHVTHDQPAFHAETEYKGLSSQQMVRHPLSCRRR